MTTGTGVLCIFAGGFILCIAILAFIAFQEWMRSLSYGRR